jgi:hypothetical protein
MIKKCYACGGKAVAHTAVKEGVTLKGERCEKCGEEFYPSGELLRFEALTGRSRKYRKFGRLGSSTIIRFPEEVLKPFGVKEGDLGLFEVRKEGILIRPVKS